MGKFLIAAVLSALVLIGAVSWYLFGFKKPAPEPVSNRVSLAIKGPEKLSSGNQTEYRIVYNNGEDADMTNVFLEVFYPQNFKFKKAEPAAANTLGTRYSLPVLKSGESNAITISGSLSGSTGEDKEIRAALHYKLSNFNSEFQVGSNFHTSILSPDLLLEITGPIEVTNGQDTTYTVAYNNVSGQDQENMAIELSYPEGFTFSSSNPPPSKDNRFWSLGKLKSGSTGKIEVTGSFSGDNGQEKTVTGNIGTIINSNFAPQVTASAGFRVAPSALSLVQTANPKEVVRLGDTVTYTLAYRNNGFIGMTNVVISVTLQGAAFDLKQVRANNAIITGNTITWKSATLKELSLISPNKSGTITFSVPLKSALSTNIKEQMMQSMASIYSDQVTKPVRSADVSLKLASNLDVVVTGEYESGALPMKVGQPTLFSVNFLLVNLSNDLTDVEVVAALPLPASTWKGVVIPESEKDNVTFDPNGSKIRWKPGNIAAFTGKFTPARMISFQLEVIPETSDQNNIITLLSDVQATGYDTYIGKPLESRVIGNVKVSDLHDDQVDSKGPHVR